MKTSLNIFSKIFVGLSVFVIFGWVGIAHAENDNIVTQVLDNFNNKDWHITTNSGGSLFWDEDETDDGVTSMKITTDGAGESSSTYVYKDIDFSLDGSFDKESYIEMNIRAIGVSNLTRLYLQFYSSVVDNIYRIAGIEKTGRKNLPESTWTTLRVALESFVPKVGETIDTVGYNFERIKFRVSDDGAPVEVSVKDIKTVTIPKKSYVILTFDDGFKSVVSKALPIMEQHNMKGTSFNIRENIGISDKYMDINDVQVLENAGWTNALHGQSPNGGGWANLSEEELDNYLASSIQYWKDNEINSGLDLVSYPNGNFGGDYDNYIYNTVKKYIKIARGTNAEATEPHNNPTDFLSLRPGLDMYMRQDISTDRMIESIERLAREGGVATIVTHRLVENDPVSNEYSINQFTTIIEKLAQLRNEGKIEILTMAEYRDLMFGQEDNDDESDEDNGDDEDEDNDSDEQGDDEDESDEGGGDDSEDQDEQECVDWDGDGWGWDGEKGCRMPDNNSDDDENNDDGNDNNNDDDEENDESNIHECVDYDGDGWGWDGEEGCKMSDNSDNDDEDDAEDEDENDTTIGECVDYDGDGWGWDGEKGCKISDNNDNDDEDDEDGNGNENEDEDDTTVGECVDYDGDGWGWDGEKGCKMPGSDDEDENDDENDTTAGECIDWDGDGWGWDGEKGCKMPE